MTKLLGRSFEENAAFDLVGLLGAAAMDLREKNAKAFWCRARDRCLSGTFWRSPHSQAPQKLWKKLQSTSLLGEIELIQHRSPDFRHNVYLESLLSYALRISNANPYKHTWTESNLLNIPNHLMFFSWNDLYLDGRSRAMLLAQLPAKELLASSGLRNLMSHLCEITEALTPKYEQRWRENPNLPHILGEKCKKTSFSNKISKTLMGFNGLLRLLNSSLKRLHLWKTWKVHVECSGTHFEDPINSRLLHLHSHALSSPQHLSHRNEQSWKEKSWRCKGKKIYIARAAQQRHAPVPLTLKRGLLLRRIRTSELNSFSCWLLLASFQLASS